MNIPPSGRFSSIQKGGLQSRPPADVLDQRGNGVLAGTGTIRPVIGPRAVGTRAGAGAIGARAAAVMDAGAGTGTVAGAMIARTGAIGARTATVMDAGTRARAVTGTVIPRAGTGAVTGTMVARTGAGRRSLLVMLLGTGLVLVPAFMTAVVVAGHQGTGHDARMVGMIRDHGHPAGHMLRGLPIIRESERGRTGQDQGRQQQTKVLCSHGITPCESGTARCGQLCPTFPA